MSYGSGRVYLDFFFTLNGTSNPALTSLDGAGIDTILSLTRTGTGLITVALKDPFVKVIRAGGEIDDTANDGAYATVGALANEGTNVGITFGIRTRSAAGTLTDFSSRKCSVGLVLRNGNWGVK
jgi:hypothetical protein